MHKIKIKVKKTYTKNTKVIQELLQADARYYTTQTDPFFNSIQKYEHKNILDILCYIEPLEPYLEETEYVEKNIKVHPMTYSVFKEIAQNKNITMQSYLELLLYKYYQLDTDIEFLRLESYEGKKFYFLNEETLKIFLYDNYFTTKCLLSALKMLKEDAKGNETTLLFFKIMQMYSKRLLDNKNITLIEYKTYIKAYKASKITYEINFIEKIIFLRHKLKTESINSDKRTRIFKDIMCKYNEKYMKTYNNNLEIFIENELYPHYEEEAIEHESDVFHLGNFKKRLELSGTDFLTYRNNLTKLLLYKQLDTKTYKNLEEIDDVLDVVQNIQIVT